jgi:hypothetical protein
MHATTSSIGTRVGQWLVRRDRQLHDWRRNELVRLGLRQS